MPNWCDNKLVVSGPDNHVREFEKKAKGRNPWKPWKEPEVLNFHSLVPIPEEILQGWYDPDGYNWELVHWGCKWGASGPETVIIGAGKIVYVFETPSSPPLVWLGSVARNYPSVRFELSYHSVGLGCLGAAIACAHTGENWQESEWENGELFKTAGPLPTAEDTSRVLLQTMERLRSQAAMEIERKDICVTHGVKTS